MHISSLSDNLTFAVALRVEFLKARARCHRWTEEIRLVQAEQTRVFISLEKKALEWETRILSADEPDQDIREGMSAYAHEQAYLYRHLSQNFAKLWEMPITDMGLYTLDDDGAEEDIPVPIMPGEEDAKAVADIADIPDSESDDSGFGSDSEDDL